MKSGINVKLLRAVKRAILEEPKRLDMSDGIARASGSTAPRCGTVGCIGGWTVLLDACDRLGDSRIAVVAEKVNKQWWDDFGELGIGSTAKKLLRLRSGQAKRLFFIDDWPPKLAKAYIEAAGNYKAAAKIAAKRIDLFIRTKGRE